VLKKACRPPRCGRSGFMPWSSGQVAVYRRAAVLQGQQSDQQGGVTDLAACEMAPDGDLLEKRCVDGVVFGQVQLPDLPAFLGLRRQKVNREIHAALEGPVDVFAEVGRHHDDALVVLQPLQEVVGLQVGVAVVGRLDVGAAAQQPLAIVEQQDHVEFFGGREDAVQVFLRLADVFVDDGGEVDAVEVEA
jgi:hypothetical protein